MSDDLIVFARNAPEMRAAQATSVIWAAGKLEEARGFLTEMEENLEHAREAKWKVSGFQSAASVARQKVRFYEKLHAALEAGYVIVPNFPIDVFAIRTAREIPVNNYELSSSQWMGDSFTKQHTDRPALGDGDYHADRTGAQQRTVDTKNDQGEAVKKYERWTTEFNEIDFPIKGVRPVIIEDTSKALALKIFDEIGILPTRRAKGDPMVIGQIVYKRGWQEKRVSFLIAWWLRESDLTV